MKKDPEYEVYYAAYCKVYFKWEERDEAAKKLEQAIICRSGVIKAFSHFKKVVLELHKAKMDYTKAKAKWKQIKAERWAEMRKSQ
jgi:hypothetical protein